MYCDTPFEAYRSKEFGRNGGRLLTQNPELAHSLEKLRLPCGQCEGCRLYQAKTWSFRLMHEFETNDKVGEFITLTYNNENLPKGKTLDHEDVKLFFKRLRRKIERRTGKRIRYFICGEYGPKTKRPHYHAIIFGYAFQDKKKFGGRRS